MSVKVKNGGADRRYKVQKGFNTDDNRKTMLVKSVIFTRTYKHTGDAVPPWAAVPELTRHQPHHTETGWRDVAQLRVTQRSNREFWPVPVSLW